MDFRDQEMWTAPLASTTETVTLTTDWTEHTVTATAPDGAVFHTRLTLSAAQGTVAIDSVSMQTQ